MPPLKTGLIKISPYRSIRHWISSSEAPGPKTSEVGKLTYLRSFAPYNIPEICMYSLYVALNGLNLTPLIRHRRRHFHAARAACRLTSGDPPKYASDCHSNPRRIATSKYVAGHYFTRCKHVDGGRPVSETHSGSVIHAGAQICKR